MYVSATNKIDNLICVIIHDNLICVIIHDNLTCVDYHEAHWRLLLYFCGAIGLFLCNKQNNTWMLGNMKFISRVEQDISLVRFAHS